MILCAKYEGDDLGAAGMQYDVYPDALRIVVDGCDGNGRFARAVLGLEPDRARPQSYDHRTLQDAHDLLAAAWRFRERPAQSALPFDTHASETQERRWLAWLRAEVAGWNEHPHIVRDVLFILAHQNCKEGYDAEERLTEALRERFPDVPWLT